MILMLVIENAIDSFRCIYYVRIFRCSGSSVNAFEGISEYGSILHPLNTVYFSYMSSESFLRSACFILIYFFDKVIAQILPIFYFLKFLINHLL